MANIASVVKECREAKGWSQQRLAEVTGLSLRTVTYVEGGKHPKLSTLMLIVDALEMSPSERARMLKSSL